MFTDGSKALVSTGTLDVDQGGTGAVSLTDGGILVGDGTNTLVTVSGGTDEVLVGGGASTAPVFTTATGTGAPVRADSSALSTQYTMDSLITKQSSETVADEASITLATGVAGWGFVQAGDNEEWIQFSFTAAGVVTAITNSANAVNTDTDGNLCVYDAGAGIAIKNRLGASKTIRYVVNYSS